ncbi:MAG: cupin domain-containing protein [Halobacteriales archaeon]
MEPINLGDVADRQDPGEEPNHEIIREDSLSVGRYVLPVGGTDPQSPHTEDEIYHGLAGQARIRIGRDEHPVEPGDVIFVDRGVDHEFIDITERLELLVVFAPAEGTNA